MRSPLALTPRPEEQIQTLFGRVPQEQRFNLVRQAAEGPLATQGPQNIAMRDPNNPYRMGDWASPIGRAESMRIPGIQPGNRFIQMPTSGEVAEQAARAREAERAMYLQAAGEALNIGTQASDHSQLLSEIFGIDMGGGLGGLGGVGGGGGGGGGGGPFDWLLDIFS